METFNIKEGEQWAGSIWSRHYHRLSGLTRFYGNDKWNFQLDMSACPDGTTIKLCGLSWLSPNLSRLKERGLKDMFSFTHEDSDRVIAIKHGHKIELKTYRYRAGQLLRDFKSIAVVANGSPFSVQIFVPESPFDGMVGYVAWSGEIKRQCAHMNRSRRCWLGTHRSFAHAIGYNQPCAPADIQIKAEVV